MLNPLCLEKGSRYHPDLDNPSLKIYKLNAYTSYEGLAAACGFKDKDEYFTISAPSEKEVKMYIFILNMEDASTWSDSHTWISEDFTEVSGVCEHHESWDEIINPPEFVYNSFTKEALDDAHKCLFGYSLNLPAYPQLEESYQDFYKSEMSFHSWEDYWVTPAS